jgi:ankyrin repeat protein
MQQKSGTPASALWSAAHRGDQEVVRHLIAEGVDVNTWDRYGRSALTFAAAEGHAEIARDLVRAGAWVDPHEDYDVYDSPLTCAACRGDRGMVEFLLAEGADPTRHAGVSQQTAEDLARGMFPEVSAILAKAEDEWRRSRTTRTTECD